MPADRAAELATELEPPLPVSRVSREQAALIRSEAAGEAGSYADRLLMEADPERVPEGSALTCFACGVRRGVAWTVSWGGEAYARRGAFNETGTKLVCLTERFARPGAYEVELGIPVGHIVTELGSV
ncbi:hypothetical protein OG936_35390 [Streptomyces sp. NBC_00846]|uniref:hypothetical protein n=1 Tax=Streptomyces sp. NBC_00846 TaxID=2975849 RepID=UPI00386992A4|nr:hypothetical protein OG936_35390 [Streptomyces sp. NBC_00846]